MKVKVFYPNHNGKIEFTRQELERLLDEVYREGQRDCNCNKSWTWTSPFYSNKLSDCIGTTTTNCNNQTSVTKDNDSIANPNLVTATNTKSVEPFTISMKINETDFNKATEALESLLNKNCTPNHSKIDDVFSSLAKELNFQ